MKKTTTALSIAALSLTLFAVGCGKAEQTSESPSPSRTETSTGPEYHKITQEEAKERIDNNKNILIVDVRQPDEYEEKHLPDALLLPLDTIGDTQPELLPDLDQEILVYCRSGRRSEQASRQLVALGYTNVYDIGGITTWPYEVEST